MAERREAILYRMVLPDHTCPYGLRAKALLEGAQFYIDERILGTREEVEATKQEFGVPTTPVVIIDGELIGGSEELESYLTRQGAGA
jgi:glutaredoxin